MGGVLLAPPHKPASTSLQHNPLTVGGGQHPRPPAATNLRPHGDHQHPSHIPTPAQPAHRGCPRGDPPLRVVRTRPAHFVPACQRPRLYSHLALGDARPWHPSRHISMAGATRGLLSSDLPAVSYRRARPALRPHGDHHMERYSTHGRVRDRLPTPLHRPHGDHLNPPNRYSAGTALEPVHISLPMAVGLPWCCVYYSNFLPPASIYGPSTLPPSARLAPTVHHPCPTYPVHPGCYRLPRRRRSRQRIFRLQPSSGCRCGRLSGRRPTAHITAPPPAHLQRTRVEGHTTSRRARDQYTQAPSPGIPAPTAVLSPSYDQPAPPRSSRGLQRASARLHR